MIYQKNKWFLLKPHYSYLLYSGDNDMKEYSNHNGGYVWTWCGHVGLRILN